MRSSQNYYNYSSNQPLNAAPSPPYQQQAPPPPPQQWPPAQWPPEQHQYQQQPPQYQPQQYQPQQYQPQQNQWAHQSSSARVARLRQARLGGAADAEEEARKQREEAALVQAELEARRAAAAAAEAAHGGWRRLGSSPVEASGACVSALVGGGCRHRVRMSPEAAAGALAGSAVAAATAVMFEGVPRGTMSGADIFRMLRDQYGTSDAHFDDFAEHVRRRTDPTPEERAADERARLEAKAALELQMQLASPSAEERAKGAEAAAAMYVQRLRAARGVEPVDAEAAADPVEATLAAMREMDAQAELRRREMLLETGGDGATPQSMMGMVLAPLQPEEHLRYYPSGAANGGAYTRRLIENAVKMARPRHAAAADAAAADAAAADAAAADAAAADAADAAAAADAADAAASSPNNVEEDTFDGPVRAPILCMDEDPCIFLGYDDDNNEQAEDDASMLL